MSSPGGCESDICPMFSQRHKRGFHHLNAGPQGDNVRGVCVCVDNRQVQKASASFLLLFFFPLC